MTEAFIINRDYQRLKNQMTSRYIKKYFEQADILINPNKNKIIEYRTNGIVIEEFGKYMFNAFGDMDLKKWHIAFTTEVKKESLIYDPTHNTLSEHPYERP